MRPIRVGLMGLGRIGRNLLRILYRNPEIEIAAIDETHQPWRRSSGRRWRTERGSP